MCHHFCLLHAVSKSFETVLDGTTVAADDEGQSQDSYFVDSDSER